MTFTETATSERRAARAGDPAALERLYREHGEAVLRLCRRRLRNDRDAEDASQETLVRAWRRLDAFDPSRPMWPWLATIAGNVCIDFQRREHIRATRHAPEDAAGASPEEAALATDDVQLVRQALRQLPSASQTVLYLRDIEGWSYGEISEREGRSAPAVRTAVTRARQQLRTQIEAAARSAGRWPLVGTVLVVLGRRRPQRTRSAASAASGLRWIDPSMAGSASGVGGVVAQLLCGALALASFGASHDPTERVPASAAGVAPTVTVERTSPLAEGRFGAREEMGDGAKGGPVSVPSGELGLVPVPLAPTVPLPIAADVAAVSALDRVTAAPAPDVAVPAVGTAGAPVEPPPAPSTSTGLLPGP